MAVLQDVLFVKGSLTKLLSLTFHTPNLPHTEALEEKAHAVDHICHREIQASGSLGHFERQDLRQASQQVDP